MKESCKWQLISDEEIILFLDKIMMKLIVLNLPFLKQRPLWHLTILLIKKVDIAIIEVGLGGRLDSTNVISPQMTAITPISLDHQHILGNDILKSIANEKAGIIKEGVPLVVSNQNQEVRESYIILLQK